MQLKKETMQERKCSKGKHVEQSRNIDKQEGNPLEYVGEIKGSLKRKIQEIETMRELKEVKKFCRRTKEIRK